MSDREWVEALANVLRRHNDEPDGNNRYTSSLQDALFNVWAEAGDNVGDYEIGELLAEAAIKSMTAVLDSPAMRDLLAEEKADAWDECVQAVAWEMGHGSWPDAGTCVRDHNPYRETTTEDSA